MRARSTSKYRTPLHGQPKFRHRNKCIHAQLNILFNVTNLDPDGAAISPTTLCVGLSTLKVSF